MSECWVYKMYCTESSGNGLLYVGISDSPSTRMGTHESQKWWWWLINSIEWERFCSRDDAKQHETACITTLHPMFNYQESRLSTWQRMEKHVRLLWLHETNSWDCPPCPICESHGIRNFMSPDPNYQLFLRNCDDKLVIHWEVGCDYHSHPVRWAQHCFVRDFLVGFGHCPPEHADKLVDDAKRLGPTVWEDRLNRETTLFERLQDGPLQNLISISEIAEATDGTPAG